MVVTGAEHLDLVEDQSKHFEVREIIVEPQPRQTAAALALAASRLERDAVMLVCPSDHHIGDTAAFRRAAARAAAMARNGLLVCIGVTPTEPDTRFGYVRRGEPLDESSFRVAEFVEKPDQRRAAEYIDSGLYSWNGGIFAFSAGDFLDELRRFRPALAEGVKKSVARGKAVGNRFFADAEFFSKIEPESVDYAVMENTDRAALVTADMQWSDVGNWEALFRMREKDRSGNSVSGPAQLIGCENVLVDSDGPKVHMIGLANVVVVVDGNDILIASASGARDVASLASGKGERPRAASGD